MPYTTDSTTGAQVPSGTTVPASSRANIRDTLANHEARLDTLEAGIDDIPIGAATPSTGAFTTVAATTITASGTITATGNISTSGKLTVAGIDFEKDELDYMVISGDVKVNSPFGFTGYYVTTTNLSVGSGIITMGGTRTIRTGTGSPNGVVTADPGSLYLNLSGGANTTLYIKESGSSSNTGWVAK